MLKKIFCIIISAVFSFGVLTGCNLFEHNYEKDYMQVILTIAPIEGTKEGYEKFVSEEKKVYKIELINQLNSQGSSMLEQGMTIDAVVKQLKDALIDRELLLIEADRLIHFQEIEWGLTQKNSIKKLVYNSIDSQLKALQNEILKEHDEPYQEAKADEEATESTYPLQPSYDQEEEEDVKDTEEWVADKTVWPAMFGSDDQKSLERESVRRLIKLFEDNIKDDFRLTDDDKIKFKNDKERIDNVINKQGIEAVYPMLYSIDTPTHYAEYFFGKNARQQIKVTQLQEFVNDKMVAVSKEDVMAAYTSLLKSQKTSFNSSSAAYTTAVEGTDTLLYHLNSDYVYVKHILLPFASSQTTQLTAMRDSKKYTEAQVLEVRERMVNDVIVYPHKNGEDDKSRPMTIKQVYNEVYSLVKRSSASVKESERAFTDMIYKYNTDPGSFTNTKGYAVKEVLEDGDTEKFMTEFALGARKLKSDYAPGEMLPEYVVTDYGVHLMYYMSDIVQSEASLNSYETYGEYQTYYKILETKVKTNNTEVAFTNWRNERITYYKNTKKVVTEFSKTYEDIIKNNTK